MLIRSILSLIFKKDTTQNLKSVSTTDDDYLLDGSDDADMITVWGSVVAKEGGTNTIATGEGQDTLHILGSVKSDNENTIDLGDGGSKLSIGGGLSAGAEGTNTITAGDDNDAIRVVGKVQSENLNEIAAGSGDNVVTLASGLSAKGDGVNHVHAEDGDDKITIGRALYSENKNIIDAGDGDNVITLAKGMEAVDGGSNAVLSGGGDDTISVCGDITVKGEGGNLIDSGAGDDVISLKGEVGLGALVIEAGEGYDTLVLSATKASTFTSNYKEWLTDLSENGGVDRMEAEVIKVDLASTKEASDLGWLGELSGVGEAVKISLDVDGVLRSMKLSDYFSDDQDDIFAMLDMTGGYRNTLTVDGSLSDYGVSANSLELLGDARDTLKLGDEWTASETSTNEASGITYQTYIHDATQELLLVQTEINVTFL